MGCNEPVIFRPRDSKLIDCLSRFKLVCVCINSGPAQFHNILSRYVNVIGPKRKVGNHVIKSKPSLISFATKARANPTGFRLMKYKSILGVEP